MVRPGQFGHAHHLHGSDLAGVGHPHRADGVPPAHDRRDVEAADRDVGRRQRAQHLDPPRGRRRSPRAPRAGPSSARSSSPRSRAPPGKAICPACVRSVLARSTNKISGPSAPVPIKISTAAGRAPRAGRSASVRCRPRARARAAARGRTQSGSLTASTPRCCCSSVVISAGRTERTGVPIGDLAVGPNEQRLRRTGDLQRRPQAQVRIGDLRVLPLHQLGELDGVVGSGIGVVDPEISSSSGSAIRAVSARNRDSARHGSHHCAQMLIIIGRPRNPASRTSRPPPRQGSVDVGQTPVDRRDRGVGGRTVLDPGRLLRLPPAPRPSRLLGWRAWRGSSGAGVRARRQGRSAEIDGQRGQHAARQSSGTSRPTATEALIRAARGPTSRP